MSMISLKNISKIYGDDNTKVKALDNINLDIEEGDMIAIMGPSGAGKSTLLNILGCIDVPTSGTYLLDGEDTSNLSSKNLAKIRNKKVGFVFQNFNLLNDYNLVENVMIPLTYSEDTTLKAKRSIKMLKEVGLGDYTERTPKQLSGGQKQRVAIARALVNEPEIILADEPTGKLDQKTGDEIMELIKSINSEGKTVIIITHDINVAKKCNSIIQIIDGKLVR